MKTSYQKLCKVVLIFFTLIIIEQAKSQCIIQSHTDIGAPQLQSNYIEMQSILAQTFSPSCTGNLSNINLTVRLNDANPNKIGLDINIYRGTNPTDVNSKKIYEIDNFFVSAQSPTINIPLGVTVDSGTNYYFTISKTGGGQLPAKMVFTYQPYFCIRGGLWSYEFNVWHNDGNEYSSLQYRNPANPGNRHYFGIDLAYSINVAPLTTIVATQQIDTTITICAGGTAKIINKQAISCWAFASLANNFFSVSISGNTATLTGKTCGVDTFTYVVGNQMTAIKRCQIIVVNPTTHSKSKIAAANPSYTTPCYYFERTLCCGCVYDTIKNFLQKFKSSFTGTLKKLELHLFATNPVNTNEYKIDIDVYKPSNFPRILVNDLLLDEEKNVPIPFYNSAFNVCGEGLCGDNAHNQTDTASKITINFSKDIKVYKDSTYYFIVTRSPQSNFELNFPTTIFPYVNTDSDLVVYKNIRDYGYTWIDEVTMMQNTYSLNFKLNGMAEIKDCEPQVNFINETHTTCLGNVIQILHYDSSFVSLKNNTTNVFNLTISGDTAFITTTNYGSASFIYAQKNVSNELRICQITVIPNNPPAIIASKKILTALTDNVTLTAEGSPNVALGFDGNTYLTIPYNKGFSSSNIFTYEGWIMCNDVNKGMQYIFSKGTDDLQIGHYGVYINAGKIVFGSTYSASNTNNFYSAANIESNKWTHIAITNDGSTIRFYFDGVEIGDAGYTTGIPDNLQDIQIGQLGNARALYRFIGQMDELRFWNVCRSPDEIKDNYNKTILGYSKGLVAYYKFDHLADNSVATDASINHNIAFINNGTSWITGSLDIPKYTYLWSNKATKQNIVPEASDYYWYNLTDLTTGCTAQSQEVKVTFINK